MWRCGKERRLRYNSNSIFLSFVLVYEHSFNARAKRSGRAKVSIGSIILVVLFVLFIVAVGLAAFFYRELSTYKDNPQKVMQEEVQAVVEQVGQIMILPQGEQPTLATVSDLSQLKDQPFFCERENWRQSASYANARKAILS